MIMSFRKCQILKSENSSPNGDVNPHSNISDRGDLNPHSNTGDREDLNPH